jgi:putative oxidoreductase
MLLHRIAKLGDVSFIEGMLSKGLPSILMAFISLKCCSLLILVGYRTRLATVVYILVLLLFLVHAADLFLLNENGGWQLELLGLYTFALRCYSLLAVENEASH